MRSHVAVGIGLLAAALLAVSAAALAEAPAAVAAPAPSLDAGQPLVSDAGAADASDASAPDAAEALADAGLADASDAGEASEASVVAVREPAGDSSDAGTYTPSDVGFSFGVRAGYSIPIGTADSSPLSSVVQGIVPIGVEAGWFLNRNLYIGGYFLYGFGIATNLSNDECSNLDSEGNEESCSATMLRFGVVADWHFRPTTSIDPWVGGGLGYDIINLEATDQAAGTLDESAALHGFIVSVESGVDFKPLSYFGLGPYAELAAGHYSSETSATSLHAWLTFGIRLRTNL
jgi:opacity protein-like surface antigen